jgi:hypothetical protein
VVAFRDRFLVGQASSYVFVDTTYCKARVNSRYGLSDADPRGITLYSTPDLATQIECRSGSDPELVVTKRSLAGPAARSRTDVDRPHRSGSSSVRVKTERVTGL